MEIEQAEQEIQRMFERMVTEQSDINLLLPKLYETAKNCEHITEMGTRRTVSSWAFAYARPKRLVCYDVSKYEEIYHLETTCKQAGIDFTFHEKDVLKVEIEETDLLFIDTFHSAEQLKRELSLHSGKVRKYIAFHDTHTFWETAEASYDIASINQTNGTQGLRYAIEPFLKGNNEWELFYKTEINNGLTIIKRK